MWDWLEQHYNALSAFFNFLTLVVWTFYLQIFLTNYRRKTRPKILINRSAGHGIDAKCAVTNMSAEAVYIEAVVVSLKVVEKDGKTVDVDCSLSDLDTDASYSGDPRPLWFQGPLNSGEMIDLGTYRSLLEKALWTRISKAPEDAAVKQMTVTVAATYIADDRMIGAERIFEVKEDGERLDLVPRSFPTRQLRRGRKMQLVKRLLNRSIQSGRVS
jgi:hypothetical protein